MIFKRCEFTGRLYGRVNSGGIDQCYRVHDRVLHTDINVNDN